MKPGGVPAAAGITSRLLEATRYWKQFTYQPQQHDLPAGQHVDYFFMIKSGVVESGAGLYPGPGDGYAQLHRWPRPVFFR